MEIKPWRSIEFGNNLRTPTALLKALDSNYYEIDYELKCMIRAKNYFWGEVRQSVVDFAKISVADLGFQDGATYEQVCGRGREIGLGLCLPQFVLQLRLQCPDQQENSVIYIAMNAILWSGRRHIFCLQEFSWISPKWKEKHTATLGLTHGEASTFYGPHAEFVFLASPISLTACPSFQKEIKKEKKEMRLKRERKKRKKAAYRMLQIRRHFALTILITAFIAFAIHMNGVGASSSANQEILNILNAPTRSR